MPTYTSLISKPGFEAKQFSSAALMAFIVSSMFSTWPCFTPLLLARPKPRISSFPNSFLRPAITAILVVPMSRPTIMGCSLFMILLFLVVYLRGLRASGEAGRSKLLSLLMVIYFMLSAFVILIIACCFQLLLCHAIAHLYV